MKCKLALQKWKPRSKTSQTTISERFRNWRQVCMLTHFSPVRLFVTLWTAVRQAPLSMGLSGQEYWSGLPCPPAGDLPQRKPPLEHPGASTDAMWCLRISQLHTSFMSSSSCFVDDLQGWQLLINLETKESGSPLAMLCISTENRKIAHL